MTIRMIAALGVALFLAGHAGAEEPYDKTLRKLCVNSTLEAQANGQFPEDISRKEVEDACSCALTRYQSTTGPAERKAVSEVIELRRTDPTADGDLAMRERGLTVENMVVFFDFVHRCDLRL